MARTFDRSSFPSPKFSQYFYSSFFTVEYFDLSTAFEPFLFSNLYIGFDFQSSIKHVIPPASSRTQDKTRHRGIKFTTTQQDSVTQVAEGCIFMANEKCGSDSAAGPERARCRSGLLSTKTGRITSVPVHDHMAHDEVVRMMRRRQDLRVASRVKASNAVPTQQVLMDVRLKTATTRWISTDALFVRRVRQSGNAPKTPADIVFDDSIKDTVLFHTDNNDIILGSGEMIEKATAVQTICMAGCSVGVLKHTSTCHVPRCCNNGVSLAFAFALLSNKKSSIYVKAFNDLDNFTTWEMERVCLEWRALLCVRF